MPFYNFFSLLCSFLLVDGLGLIGHPMVFQGCRVSLDKEINLFSTKSMYVTLNISKKGMTYWGAIWCFLIEILDCKIYSSKIH